MQITVTDRVMHVAGQVDGRHTPELRDALQGWIEDTQPLHDDLVLDLGAVESIDMTALRVIAMGSRDVGEQARRLRLRSCSPLVRRLLHLSHLRPLVLFDEAV